MPYQVKTEPPVEPLYLNTMQVMFDAHKMMYDFGYRGSFSTTASLVISTPGGEPEVVESGRFDMVLQGSVPVNASLGDVILYRTNPPEVVACMSHDQFLADYETV